MIQGHEVPLKTKPMPIYISLHDAHPQAEGDNEIAYPGYARAMVTHDDVTIGEKSITNCRDINFPKCDADFEATATHFAVRLASTGIGHVITGGGFGAAIKIERGITPSFLAGNWTVYAYDPADMRVLVRHLTERDTERPEYLDRFRVVDEEDGRLSIVDLKGKVCCQAKKMDNGWLGIGFVDEDYKPRLKSVGLYPNEHALVAMLSNNA